MKNSSNTCLLLFLSSVLFQASVFGFRAIPQITTVKHTNFFLNAGKPVDITFEGTGKTLVAEQGERIDIVAKRAGVFIPFKVLEQIIHDQIFIT